MSWLRKISHGFWLWIDRKILVHRASEQLYKLQRDLVAKNLNNTLYGSPEDMTALGDIIDDVSIKKGYES